MMSRDLKDRANRQNRARLMRALPDDLGRAHPPDPHAAATRPVKPVPDAHVTDATLPMTALTEPTRPVPACQDDDGDAPTLQLTLPTDEGDDVDLDRIVFGMAETHYLAGATDPDDDEAH